ncbi:F-box domain-containing protein [Metarhizium robertsii ARSEF 23]|uniref:F-box domain-containing protein n=1 Tax=Metarhizium robertsii (strain ARSEF 23 / ATCC MYA-3075) TaxID=655844 RepID=E9EW20_METRA|nr:F-box domain-containing protein [Metarhizium robertsii ARSEF 23]EFZ00442.2 F-box domain-containing protein [Metarhizium robertsii ARSEF 23]
MSWIAVPSRLYYKLKRNTHAAPKPTTGPSPAAAAVQPRRPPNTRLCHPPAMNLALLPYTVFFEIVSHLSAPEALASRRISRDVRSALVRPDLSISLILLHFPRSIEGRALRGHLRAGRHGPLEEEDWAAVFATLARRYHHLGSATPWRVDKVRVAGGPGLRGVTPWNRFLRLDDKTAAFDYWDPVWAFAPRQGVLVYPAAAAAGAAAATVVYRARDLASGDEAEVPFDAGGKVVRRVRLSHGILVVEWCEEEQGRDEPDGVGAAAHRHFATAFDVVPASCGRGRRRRVQVSFRSEWKTHCLGLPLSHQDRFFSTHNATHYVVYIWQPTRSPWGEHAPLERLVVWDISRPSPYRPSLDPAGRLAPSSSSSPGPRIMRRIANDDLSGWGVRQADTPRLRGLALDRNTWDADARSATGHVFLVEEEHRWCAGPHSSATPPRQHHLRTTGIPLVGDGPRWVDDCGGRGTFAEHGMEFCPRGCRASCADDGVDGVDAAEDSSAWPGRTPCWRHDDFPYLTVSEAHDALAGVRITARHCFMMETLSVHVRPRLCVEGVARYRSGDRAHAAPDDDEVRFEDGLWPQLMGKGCIAGDERWVVGEDEDGDVTILMF